MRSQAGLDPSKVFTTNSSESINHDIKQEVQWKESKLPTLIEHLKAITAQHQTELQKAIVGRENGTPLLSVHVYRYLNQYGLQQ